MNSYALNLSSIGLLHNNCINHTPKRNNPPSQRLWVIIIKIVEIGAGKGVGIINLAGGKLLISFAIDNGSSQHKPNKNPN